jgi:uncharacterized membrane protein
MAKSDTQEWLRGEIRTWQTEGLISRDQAEVLQARYPVDRNGRSWGMIIFSCLGAVIIGLGVILLLAYNWDAIPKFAKLAIILGAVALTHLSGLWLKLGAERTRALGEGISLLGSMLFGAGIFLVAQIYHIDEHFPNAFLIWGLGALSMAVVMPSIPQAILAATLLTVWGGAERLAFDTPIWVAPACIALILGSLAWRRRSRILLAVLIPAFLFSYGFSLPAGGDSSWLLFSTFLSFSAVLIAFSQLAAYPGNFSGAAPIFGFYGWVSFWVMLYLMSFPKIARDLFYWHGESLHWPSFVFGLIPLSLALVTWIGLAYWKTKGRIRSEEGDPGWEVYLVPLTVILGMVDLTASHAVEGWVIAGPFNLVFIGMVASMMARGCREGLLKPTVIGSVLLVLLVVARYFDLFESQLIRGSVFLAVGLVLLVEGFLYSRSRRQKEGRGLQ